MLRLCDKAGWSYSRAQPACGSIFKLAWTGDSTQVGRPSMRFFTNGGQSWSPEYRGGGRAGWYYSRAQPTCGSIPILAWPGDLLAGGQA
eukprot:scaffold18618_cov65-Isochrysis_galbana.AAC.2